MVGLVCVLSVLVLALGRVMVLLLVLVQVPVPHRDRVSLAALSVLANKLWSCGRFRGGGGGRNFGCPLADALPMFGAS